MSLATILLSLSTRAGNDIVLKQSKRSSLVMREDSYLHVRIVNTISVLQQFNVKTPRGVFAKLQADQYEGSNVYGDPQLPVLRKLIEIPLGARPSVKIISYTVKEYKLSDFGINLPLFPAQPPVSKGEPNPEFVYNVSAYQQESFTNNDLATVDVLGILRGTRLGRLNISPVSYNPVSNTIRVYDSLVVDVAFTGGDVTRTKAEKLRYDSPYFRTVYDRLINYRQSDNLLSAGGKYPIKYVIVSPPMFHDALQPFIAWKKKKGFTVVEAYTSDVTVGTTTASIKNYLYGLYAAAAPGNPAPSFVLFVGDVAQIPAFPCAEGHVTDLYYCEYTGDFLPEVFYGRFSANTPAQLQPQIDKSLEYEQYLMPDPSFLDKVVMASGADESHQMTWSNGQINYGTTNYFNAAHGLTSYTYLQPEPPGADYSRQIHLNVSNGIGYANYTAHGSSGGWDDPSFLISDINGLQNAHKYPLIVGNCCLTSAYDGNSFAEELLRAAGKGALGYIGCSNNSYWDEDYWWGVGVGPISANPTYVGSSLGAYDRTFHDHGEPYEEWYSSMAQMIFAGNLAVTESGSDMKQYYWETYCLMGDPSLMIYFSRPAVMEVSYSQQISLDSRTFTVFAEPYAYVAFSKGGVLYGAAEADVNGVAVVSLDPLPEPGLANVVVTRQNRQPFTGTTEVAIPDGPFVLFDTCQINDSSGNNNQVADFGENIKLNISLKNMGNGGATDVVSTLSCKDEFLTITEARILTSFIPGRSSARVVFSATINDFLPDQHVVRFRLCSSGDTNNWISDFAITLSAPRLITGHFTMEDVTGGNGNGVIDPGETITISIPTFNSGHGAADATTGLLLATGEYATVKNTGVALGTLAVNGSTNAVFSFAVSPAAPAGSIINLHYFASSGRYSVPANFYPVVGTLAEDFETGDFSKFAWHMSEINGWSVTQDSRGKFSARSGIIGDKQSSELYLSGNALMDDSISFYSKVSSESGFDYLKFYIDGQEIKSWSGNVDWTRGKFPVAMGEHTFKWTYEKDNSIKGGDDVAMIDDVIFPSFAKAFTVDAMALPSSICSGGQTRLFGFASGGSGPYTYSWSPSDGLSDTGIFNPIADPQVNTLYTVKVKDGSSFASAGASVQVQPLPKRPMIAQYGIHLESSAATGNQWYNTGGLINGATEQTYIPENTDDFYVIVSSAQGCASAASNAVHLIFSDLKESDDQLVIYPNPVRGKVKIRYTLTTGSKVKLAVYNAIGNEIAILSEPGMQAAGIYRLEADLSAMPVGVYYCMLLLENEVFVKKVLRIR